MPEGNEVHRFRDRHHATFTGRTVRVDSPSRQFADATALDRRKLRGIHARGKHLGYDFGGDLILHVHLGRFDDFSEGTMPLAKPQRRAAAAHLDHDGLAGAARPDRLLLYDEENWDSLLARLGPDPLEKGADPEPAFCSDRCPQDPDWCALHGPGRHRQHLRAELLYRARLSPFRPGSEVDAKTIRAMHMEGRHHLDAGRHGRPADRHHPAASTRAGTARRSALCV